MAVQRKSVAPAPEDLLALARDRFVHGERIDIQTLAEELGISRATAYRWAGNAEALTARVIAQLGEETFHRCVREARGKGWERILDAHARGLRAIASFKPYRIFLERDPEAALRIVASKQGAPQQTTIRLTQEHLEREARAGRIHLSVDAHTLAYAIVRISESFLYADLIAGEEPDVNKAVEILRLLFSSGLKTRNR
jgi:AcrR family transcriptional regulator